MRSPAAAKRSRKTSGRVNNDGPMPQLKPSARHSFTFPPGVSFFSHTSTWWPARASRIAAASPPNPAPITRIFFTEAMPEKR